MDLSSAIDWWDEWKLRILVVCSLFVHSSLQFSHLVRTWYSLRRLRVLVWIAYIGSDALAIYALAILFNRQKQQITAAAGGGGGNGNSAIEVIWAPFLLIHLGGQGSITAYSIEDNELWKRHVITLASQVTVALYVFCKWWSGETRLLNAAIFLFIVGIIKFSQKPWALRRASYATITNTLSRSSRAEDKSSFSFLWWLVCFCISNGNRELEQNKGRNDDIKYSLKNYVKQARNHIKEEEETKGEEENVLKAALYTMFVDLSAPYSVRLKFLRSFLNFKDRWYFPEFYGPHQHSMLRQMIQIQFETIYTWSRSTDRLFIFITFLLVSLEIASVVLFAKSDMDGYNKSDITVTYILFYATVVMELAPSIIFVLSRQFCFCLCPQILLTLHWQDMVAQHNVMSFCARNKKPSTLMKLATFSFLRDYINKHHYWHKEEAKRISMLVCQHAVYGWKEYINDAASYRRFNNFRGEHTLMKMRHHLLSELGWSFDLPFDEYVLLWHLATDLCIHQSTNHASTSTSASGEAIVSRRRSSEIISNYMIYLLFIRPEMLIPGARSDLFMLACNDIQPMIKVESPSSSLGEIRRGIADQILGMEQQGEDQLMNKALTSTISNALKLARVLFERLSEEERWEVLEGVWVEMLCYSASRCRGYLHAKSLGVAGEFLTNVWLLWWCMGMQTLPDMMNNQGPPEEQTAAAAPNDIQRYIEDLLKKLTVHNPGLSEEVTAADAFV